MSIATLTPEERAAMVAKSTITRKAGAEARKAAIANGLDLKTPIKAIRAKCLDCCGGQYSEVEKCTVPACPLFLYRFGKRPRDFSDIMGDKTNSPVVNNETIDIDIDVDE